MIGASVVNKQFFLKTASFLNHSLCSVSSPIKLSFRSTWILKRRFEPEIKENDFTYLNEFNYVYDQAADRCLGDKGTIDLVLTQFVEDLGKRGQIVTVPASYGYAHLLLPRLAVYATPENIAKENVLTEEDIEKHSTITAYKTCKMLSKKVLSVFMNMDEQWTIQPWHIRVCFRKDGVDILSDECIQLPDRPISGPDLSLEGKDFAVLITINNVENVAVRCRLRHWTVRYSDKLPLPPDHDRVPSEPIFPEQAEILNSIPLPTDDDNKKTK